MELPQLGTSPDRVEFLTVKDFQVWELGCDG